MIVGMLVNHHNPVFILQKWGPLAEDCKSNVTKKSLNIYTPNPVIGVYQTDFKYQDLNWKMTFPWHGQEIIYIPPPTHTPYVLVDEGDIIISGNDSWCVWLDISAMLNSCKFETETKDAWSMIYRLDISAMLNSCKFETETKDASSMIYRFQLGLSQRIKLVFTAFSTKHVASRSSSKYWLACNQENVSQWSSMSTRRLVSMT